MDVPSTKYIPNVESDTVDHYFKSVVSFSHLMGTITGIVTDYVTSAFGKSFIQTIWNSREEPFAQRSQAFRDIMHRPRPTLLIEPKFDPSEESEFRPLSEFDSEIANLPNADIKYGIRNASLLVERNNFQLYFRPRRFKMSFSLSFCFDSDIQRIQAQQYIRQAIRHRLPIVLQAYVENSLPTEYMHAIAKMNNYDPDSEEFITWINETSLIPIRYRYRTGSGKYEYFATLKVPVDMRFTEGPSSDGPVRKGNIVVQSSFSENIEVEFVAASVYFMRTNTEIGSDITPSTFISDTMMNTSETMQVVSVDNIFSKQIPMGDEVINGYAKYRSINIQADKSGDDTINIYDLIQETDIKTMVDFYRKNGMKIDFINLLVYEDILPMDSSRLVLNRDTLDLTIRDMTIYQSYYINIYVNRAKINSIKDELFGTGDK